MSQSLQLFDVLPAPIEDALRASIERFGVLVPIVKDQNGRVLDGHHRARIADDLRVSYRVDVMAVASDEEAAAIQVTLNADRRQLTPDQRREVVLHLAMEVEPDGTGKHSTRAMAEIAGVDPMTILSDLNSAVERSTAELPKYRRGLDGKTYPARRPIIAARNEREAERAQLALGVLGSEAPGRVVDVRRIERVAREHEAEQRRSEPVAPLSRPGMDIRHGDFREVLGNLEIASVDAIITDPPYPRQFWDGESAENVYRDLGLLAARVLKPTGILAVMIGTRPEMADQVEAQLGANLILRWRAIYLTPGPRWRDQQERVATGYKPVLLYSTEARAERPWILDDVFSSAGDDKAHHHWGQSESGMAQMVERLTEPGALVVDPFLGGGTMAVICRELGRPFIGCDVDPSALVAVRERIG